MSCYYRARCYDARNCHMGSKSSTHKRLHPTPKQSWKFFYKIKQKRLTFPVVMLLYIHSKKLSTDPNKRDTYYGKRSNTHSNT